MPVAPGHARSQWARSANSWRAVGSSWQTRASPSPQQQRIRSEKVRPSRDYEWKLAHREYGTGEAKEARAEARRLQTEARRVAASAAAASASSTAPAPAAAPAEAGARHERAALLKARGPLREPHEALVSLCLAPADSRLENGGDGEQCQPAEEQPASPRVTDFAGLVSADENPWEAWLEEEEENQRRAVARTQPFVARGRWARRPAPQAQSQGLSSALPEPTRSADAWSWSTASQETTARAQAWGHGDWRWDAEIPAAAPTQWRCSEASAAFNGRDYGAEAKARRAEERRRAAAARKRAAAPDTGSTSCSWLEQDAASWASASQPPETPQAPEMSQLYSRPPLADSSPQPSSTSSTRLPDAPLTPPTQSPATRRLASGPGQDGAPASPSASSTALPTTPPANSHAEGLMQVDSPRRFSASASPLRFSRSLIYEPAPTSASSVALAPLPEGWTQDAASWASASQHSETLQTPQMPLDDSRPPPASSSSQASSDSSTRLPDGPLTPIHSPTTRRLLPEGPPRLAVDPGQGDAPASPSASSAALPATPLANSPAVRLVQSDSPPRDSAPALSCADAVAPTSASATSVALAPLPEGWTQHVDPASGCDYYWYAATGASRWSRPAEDAYPPTPAPIVADEPLPEGWTQHLDPDTKITYYWHAASNHPQWERPVSHERFYEV